VTNWRLYGFQVMSKLRLYLRRESERVLKMATIPPAASTTARQVRKASLSWAARGHHEPDHLEDHRRPGAFARRREDLGGAIAVARAYRKPLVRHDCLPEAAIRLMPPVPARPRRASPSGSPQTPRSADGRDRAACCRRRCDGPDGRHPSASTLRSRRATARQCATRRACDPPAPHRAAGETR
jgi:hypothetical protein